jgi:hypothetical protein
MRCDGGGGDGDGEGESITGEGLAKECEGEGVAACCGAAHDTSEATIRMANAGGRLIAVTQSA